MELHRRTQKQTVIFRTMLNQAAVLRGDMAQVLETLQRGLAAQEHAAFVKQLMERE